MDRVATAASPATGLVAPLQAPSATGDFKKLSIKRYARLPGRKTAEQRYWRKFKSPILIKEFDAISCVHFSPAAPHDFVVATSTRAQVYSSQTHSVKKTISRFKDVVRSAAFRDDGKLLVAGDSTGLVQVFDLSSRAVLRTLRSHVHPVHVAAFSSNNTQILTCSDDKTVRVWDLATETPIQVFSEHEDYVRAGMVSPDNPSLVLSGSYDHSIKLWDLRSSSSSAAITMRHTAPVESVLFFPSGSLCAAAGGPNVKIFDLLSGGKQLYSLSNHQKTVMSLCLDGAGSRLLTGSLDHHVKVFNVTDYSVVHSVKYPAPVLRVALSPDDKHLVAGMSTGLLSIRQRQVAAPEVATRRRDEKELRGGSYKWFVRGKGHAAAPDDFRIESKRRKALKDYDKYLKSFQYGNALDAALSMDQPALTVVSLLQELVHRNGLRAALAGRDDIALEPLAQFVVKHITNPRFAPLLVDVTEIVIDMYSAVLGQSPLIDELFQKLQGRLVQEISFQRELMKVQGELEMVFALSSTQSAPQYMPPPLSLGGANGS